MPSERHCRSPLYRNGSKSRNPVPLWDAIFRRTRSACLQDGIVVRPITATAANPVIRCRCGMPVSLSFCRRSFPCWKVPGEAALRRHLLEFVISRPASEASLAALCKIPVWKVPGETAFLHHLPGVGSVPDGLWVRCGGFGGGEFGGWATGRGGHGGVAGNEFGGCGGEPAVLVECFA